ncbi:endo-beta-1-4-glucanase B [Penicillium macrosclerotiorum]|uniref:endo-beta-1-4-glucanase B n=1 Tax=Penicillium macrosclerotiorum TaxID=303699 RepID=UPI002548A308|nr:endo-beta-1-4-glucanase B [Penicillium macrosclerotiorum]KAJ5683375.1 endo-beta-1-4-glucanase B [Penicillium macrosclerotiorum]
MRYTLLLAASAALALAVPQGHSKRASSFVWFGTSESCAEFGNQNIPGVLGTDYTWPDTSTIKTLYDGGMNIFRVPFMMERLVPGTLTSSPDATYLQSLKSTVEYITSIGAYAIVDPHNFGRYYGNIITSTSDFAAFWTTVATQFASNDKVIFDTNNEFNSEDQTLVLNLNQAAINAIRAAGATSQYIFVEGNSWSGAWTWTSVNTNLVSLTDPQNKIVYEMHQYLDSDGSGTSETCVSSTIGQERVQSATEWLQSNGKLGFLGEFAGGANSVCQSAVTGMLDYMEENSDVWLGASWWAAGPWWSTYIYSMEPPSGTAYTYYFDILSAYFPSSSGGSGSSTSTSSTSTTTRSTSTTTSTTTSKTTTTTTKTTTSTGSTATATAAHWGQCGGIGWTGATTCASGYTCQVQNAYYSQCL